jgi:sec-independent protein translocase protein TatC
MARRLPASDGSPDLEDRKMSLVQHLQELRLRLRNSMLVFAAATVAASFFAYDFFFFLARPVEAALASLKQAPTIVKVSPAEGFWVQMKLSLVLGVAIALPLVLWEIWKFVAPGLYRRERRLAVAMTVATAACFLGGAVFGYTLLSPATHLFLLGEGIKAVKGHELVVINMLTMESVADFQITMLLGCGVAFELPIVLGLLGWLGLIGARGMWRFNRYALVLAAVAGAVLTPGSDVYSQLMLAGPLFVLYNVSIALVWLIEKRRKVRPDVDSPLLLLVAAWPAVRRSIASRAARTGAWARN